MELTHIEHLGIAVKSIEACLPYYEEVLGLKCYNIEEVADQKVKTAFFKVGQTKIELLEPTSEDSTIAKFIEKKIGNYMSQKAEVKVSTTLHLLFPTYRQHWTKPNQKVSS